MKKCTMKNTKYKYTMKSKTKPFPSFFKCCWYGRYSTTFGEGRGALHHFLSSSSISSSYHLHHLLYIMISTLIFFHHHSSYHHHNNVLIVSSFSFSPSYVSLSSSLPSCCSGNTCIFTKNDNDSYYYSRHSYAFFVKTGKSSSTTTTLNGVASRIYDMDAITESTTDFRKQFASFADDKDEEGEDVNEDVISSSSSRNNSTIVNSTASQSSKNKGRRKSNEKNYNNDGVYDVVVDDADYDDNESNSGRKVKIQEHHINHVYDSIINNKDAENNNSSVTTTSTKLGLGSREYRTTTALTKTSHHHIFKRNTQRSNAGGRRTRKSAAWKSMKKHTRSNLNAPYTNRSKEEEEKPKQSMINNSRPVGASNSTSGGLGLHLSYESAIQVLRTYHSIHGHVVIPRRYKIPSTPQRRRTTTSSSSSSAPHLTYTYPKQWHNIDIASTVYNMNWWTMHVKSNPERVKELNTLGFVWERLQPEWNLVLEAVVIYKEIHGHVKVPATFIVPYCDDDDEHNENHQRNTNHYEDTTTNNNNISWPKATWGIPLGNCVHRIRARGDYLRNDEVAWSRRQQLDGLGFIWDIQEHSFERFFTALKIYAKVEQQKYYHAGGGRRSKVLRVPRSFVIPSTDTVEKYTNGRSNDRSSSSGHSSSHMPNPWPVSLWGYPLGVKCSAVRQKGLYIKNNPERQKALQEIGFQMNGNNSIGWLNIVWASAIWVTLHGEGTLDVPIHFVVPSPPSVTAISKGKESSSDMVGEINSSSIDRGREKLDTIAVDESWPWPEQLWGFPLGQRLKDVRVKGAHLKSENSAQSRRAQLDALGFVWQPKRGRRKRCLGG